MKENAIFTGKSIGNSFPVKFPTRLHAAAMETISETWSGPAWANRKEKTEMLIEFDKLQSVS